MCFVTRGASGTKSCNSLPEIYGIKQLAWIHKLQCVIVHILDRSREARTFQPASREAKVRFIVIFAFTNTMD